MDAGERDEPIMLSALQHYSYCPRQCALIHVEQAFEENVYTQRGNAVHKRVDEPGFEERTGVHVERALPVWSERIGLIGKCDVVEFLPDGTPYPVEYKHGPKRPKIHDDIQLAAQALCLEDMTGKAVSRGAIFHHTSRRRREVEITETLRRQVEETVAAVRALLASGVLPAPVNDARCNECSLKDICQPEAVAGKSKVHIMRSTLFDPEDECAKS
ncbi:MAG: CRISPR-associated protein Cas4 [Sulfuricella sp.]|nr:CRISPR-associated protein Cas4 [Sulfuricella sp.]